MHEIVFSKGVSGKLPLVERRGQADLPDKRDPGKLFPIRHKLGADSYEHFPP